MIAYARKGRRGRRKDARGMRLITFRPLSYCDRLLRMSLYSFELNLSVL